MASWPRARFLLKPDSGTLQGRFTSDIFFNMFVSLKSPSKTFRIEVKLLFVGPMGLVGRIWSTYSRGFATRTLNPSRELLLTTQNSLRTATKPLREHLVVSVWRSGCGTRHRSVYNTTGIPLEHKTVLKKNKIK